MSKLYGISGRIRHLRLNDSAYNQPYGPPGDTLSTQVVVELEGYEKYFGL